MSIVEINAGATDESVGYEVRGYKLHEEVFLTCPSCNKNLVSLLVVKKECSIMEGISSASFQTSCPLCNVKSFKRQFNNTKLYYQAVEPFGMTDMDIDTDKNPPLIFITVK